MDMDTLKFSLDAILPLLLIVAAGYVMSRIGPWNSGFYKALNSICFHFFLPIQIFMNVYSIESLSDLNWRAIGFIVAGIFFCLFLGFFLSSFVSRDPGRRAVLTQSAFRSNQAILGLPLAQALGGAESMAFASMVTSFSVPIFNTLGVIILTLGGRGEHSRLSFADLFRRVISNPLVISGLAGLFVVVLRQFIPVENGEPVFMIKNQLYPVYEAMNKLSVIASPMMLFVLGARFEFSAVRKLMKPLIFGSLMRLVICPAIIIGAAILLKAPLGLGLTEMPTLVAVCSTPCGVSGAVMAQELGCDDQLASQLVVWTTLFSLFTIFTIVFTLRSVGFL